MSSSDSFSQEPSAAPHPEPVASAEKSGLPPAKPLRFDKAENQDLRVDGNGDGDEINAKFGASLFKKLVTTDEDLVGLVAYGLYKQNEYEWLAAFEKSCGRRPTGDESNAYVLGEGTPRRLASYRQLAESALAARTTPNPPSSARFLEREPSADMPPKPASTRRPPDAARAGAKRGVSLFYLVFMTALAVLCVWLLVHFNVVRM